MSTLKTGIHHGLPMADYLALAAVSSSRLKDLGRSPAYCHHRMTESSPATDATNFGSFVDALLLEPETARDRFLCAGPCAAKTKAGKACGNNGSLRLDGEWFCGVKGHAPEGATPPTAPVLKQPDYDRAFRVWDALQAHPWWQRFADRKPATQQTLVWRDMETDLVCKGRPDACALDDAGSILMDLKVTREACQNVYPRKCVSLWHPQQLAWYAAGYEEHGVHVTERWILAVHPEPPHEVTAYRMSDDLNAWADRVVYERHQTYAHCVAQDWWPAGDYEVTVPLPDWATIGPKVEIDWSGIEDEEEAA